MPMYDYFDTFTTAAYFVYKKHVSLFEIAIQDQALYLIWTHVQLYTK